MLNLRQEWRWRRNRCDRYARGCNVRARGGNYTANVLGDSKATLQIHSLTWADNVNALIRKRKLHDRGRVYSEAATLYCYTSDRWANIEEYYRVVRPSRMRSSCHFEHSGCLTDYWSISSTNSDAIHKVEVLASYRYS